MTVFMDICTMMLLATWCGAAIGLGVLILARLANLIVSEFLNQ